MIGWSLLSYEELQEVLLDIEICMNNRPLFYQGEEFEQPVFTPNMSLSGRPNPILEEDLEKIGEEEVTRQMRFLQKNKEHVWKRFVKEYVHALEERQQLPTSNIAEIPNTGALVLLKDETKNRALWKLARVVGKVTGKDGTVWGLKLKQGNGYIVEHPLQLICKLEIGGEDPDCQPNPEAVVFRPRLKPSRRSKEIANERIKDIVSQEV